MDRDRFGVEPICRGRDVSASYPRATGQRSGREVEDERLLAVIGELHAKNYYACGIDVVDAVQCELDRFICERHD